MRDRSERGTLRVLIVADANVRAGFGHLMRTRGLVEALGAERRTRVHYLGRYSRRAAALLRRWGYGVRRAPERGRVPALARTLALRRPHVVIFDAYRRLEGELRRAAGSGARVVLFEDRESRGRAAVDVRVAFNPSRRSRRPPRPARRHLVGLRYLCLRPEIVRERERGRGAGGRAPRGRRPVILVSLGGGGAGDPLALARRLAPAAPAAEWIALAERQAGPRAGLPRVRVRAVGDPRAAARAMAGATAAAAAAGTTAWELACLGVPAVVWPLAPNQRPILRLLDGRAALACRRRRDVPRALIRLLADPGLARRLSCGGRALVDGRGARRVAGEVHALLGRPGAGRRGWPPVDTGPGSE